MLSFPGFSFFLSFLKYTAMNKSKESKNEVMVSCAPTGAPTEQRKCKEKVNNILKKIHMNIRGIGYINELGHACMYAKKKRMEDLNSGIITVE